MLRCKSGTRLILVYVVHFFFWPCASLTIRRRQKLSRSRSKVALALCVLNQHASRRRQ
jgi:hypothetical protein